jgi:trans-2-enoyl-CoA reductase
MRRTKDIFLVQREKETREGTYNYLINKLKEEQLYQQNKIESNAERTIRQVRKQSV